MSLDLGVRLGALERRLRLLLVHLAGPAIRRRVDVDDLVQEVFLRAVAARGLPPPEEGEAALLRFLQRIARHTVVDVARALRAQKRAGHTERLAHSDWSRFGPGAPAPAADTPGPATRVASSEEEQRILRAFDGLPPEHQRVIGLRQFEGRSARETARRMGRSEAAVHSLYRRALAAWERRLEKKDGPSDESEPGARLDQP